MKNVNVIAFGGLGHDPSKGLLDALNAVQKVPGVDIVDFVRWQTWEDQAKRVRWWRDDTVFWGHSFGATAALGVARALWQENRGPAIPLICTVDPSQWWWMGPSGAGGNKACPRALRVNNYYQGRRFPIGNQKVVRDDGSEMGVINMLISNTSHTSIDDDPRVQGLLVRDVKNQLTRLNP